MQSQALRMGMRSLWYVATPQDKTGASLLAAKATILVDKIAARRQGVGAGFRNDLQGFTYTLGKSLLQSYTPRVRWSMSNPPGIYELLI